MQEQRTGKAWKLLSSDIYIKPNSVEELESILEMEKKLGYRYVGIDANFMGKDYKIPRDLYTGYTIKIVAATENEAKNALKNVKKDNPLVIGFAKDQGAMRVFSRDRRVDILEVEPRLLHFLDRNQSILMKQGKTALGINLKIIRENPRFVAVVDYYVKFSLKYLVPLVVFSESNSIYDTWPRPTVMHLFRYLAYSISEVAYILKMSEEFLENKRREK